MSRLLEKLFLVALACALYAPSATAENIKIGTIKVAGAGPLYLAQERGYFTAEGLNVDFVYFDASQPIAVATVSGDVEIGVTPPTAAFYALAGQGVLRIISGYIMDAPSFQANGAVASNAAYAAGFHSFKDMAGRKVSTTQMGAAPHYAWALMAEHAGVDLKSVQIVALQSNSNQVSAVVGGQVDAAMMPSTFFTPALEAGQVKLLGFVGDIAPWQLGATFTSTKIANERPDTIKRFIRAYIKGIHDYHDAFTGPDEKRADMPTAPDVLAVISKYVGQSPEQVKRAVSYIEREGRLDFKDILHQIAWYKSQGMLKDSVSGDEIIDKRYAVPLPGQ
jgi:NitT/TauT family transport system substrate-binding protein